MLLPETERLMVQHTGLGLQAHAAFPGMQLVLAAAGSPASAYHLHSTCIFLSSCHPLLLWLLCAGHLS